MRRLTIICVLAACSSAPAPTTPILDPTTTVAPFAYGKPLVTPGERMTYRMSLRGIAVASYTISVGDLAVLDGNPIVIVESHAKSVGIASLMTKVDDRFTSWIDVTSGRPRRFQTAELEAASSHTHHAIVDFAQRANGQVPVSFQVGDTGATPEAQKVTLADVWDYNAFLVALRAWEAPAGATVALEVFRSRYLWKIDVKVHGKARLRTELGELPAVRFDAHAVKLARDGTKYPDTAERNFSIWISDEGDRVPLKHTAESDHGDIEMVITDYVPGTGQRLRAQ